MLIYLYNYTLSYQIIVNTYYLLTAYYPKLRNKKGKQNIIGINSFTVFSNPGKKSLISNKSSILETCWAPDCC